MLQVIAYYSRGNERSKLLTPAISCFAGGEVQIRLELTTDNLAFLRIVALLKSADDVMALLMLTDALRRQAPMTPIHLDLPYVPYARQDRVCNPGEALSAKVFCQLINSQNYASVNIDDPHSDVVPALLDRVQVIDASVHVAKVLCDPRFAEGVVLLAPDAGARKRVGNLAKRLGVAEIAFADKVRDPLTGSISNVRFPEIASDLPILVVDDICDGGRTFIELARAASETANIGRERLNLYVTHGIYSRGLDDLGRYYNGIYTAYNWLSPVTGSFLNVR